MTSIIAIANIAGGTQKTTASHSLAVAMVEYGKKVLLVDLDPRSELTFNLGLERSRLSIVEMLQGSVLSQSNDITTEERFDFVGADSRLASIADVNCLKAFLDTSAQKFDIVIIDTPSAIDPRLAMAVLAADALVIPSSSSIHSVRGAMATARIESKAVKYILPIQDFDIAAFAGLDNAKFIDAHIPQESNLDVAISHKRSALSTDKNSDFAQAYREAAYSILEELNHF
jgi:cellulose biosynthesis protein BcsQ